MDKFEVTNIQYKAFVDAGGYTNPAYWTEPILVDGKEMVIDEAAKLLSIALGDRDPPAGKAGSIRQDWKIIRSLECPGMKRLPMRRMSIKNCPPSMSGPGRPLLPERSSWCR